MYNWLEFHFHTDSMDPGFVRTEAYILFSLYQKKAYEDILFIQILLHSNSLKFYRNTG